MTEKRHLEKLKLGFQKIDVLPPQKNRKGVPKQPAYLKLLTDISKSPTGFYAVNIEGRNWKTVFSVLNSKIKNNKDFKKLKLHVRDSSLIIEKA